MVADGIRQIGDGLLEVAEERLQALLVSGVDINEVYDVEQTPFARGKFAAVRRAVHKKSGVHYAAKFLRRRRRAQCTVREIGHEIAVLMLCADSKHIVKLNAVHESKSETALILELATGGELQAILDEEGSLTEAQAQTCMREILAALQYLHSKRIAHLDIKPQNILLCGDKVEDGLKLCDFGISRLVAEVGEVREILGTPDYVAPEVLQYEPLSLATDIWSIGVLAYVLLTGCSPFGGDTKQETFLNISQCTLNFPEDLFEGVSDEAMDFIRSALRIKPKERMTATECLNHQWLRGDATARLDLTPIQSISLNIMQSLDQPSHELLHHCDTTNPLKHNSTSSGSSTPSSSSSVSATAASPNRCCSDTTIPQITSTATTNTTTATTHVYISLTPATAQPPTPTATPSSSTPPTPKEPIYFKCNNNKENLSSNIKYFGLNFKPTDNGHTITHPSSTTNTATTTTTSALVSPAVHHFPDAPTTPKVCRKSSPASPPSVKALVKKFQLASPDSTITSAATAAAAAVESLPVIPHSVTRRTEFSGGAGDSAANTPSARGVALDTCVVSTSTSSSATLCRAIKSISTASPVSLSVIRKPLSVEQGIIC